MKHLFALLVFCAGSLFFQPAVAQTRDSITETTVPQVETTANKGNANVLLTQMPTPSFKIKSVLKGILGMVVLLVIGFLFSKDRRNIPWKTVAVGLIIQIVLAIGVLYVPFIRTTFEFFGQIFVKILDFTKAGSEFLLGDLMNAETYGFIFLFQVLPTIIFFSALTSLLFYWGIIQKVVYALAWVFTKALKISGAEALSVAGNIFLGQTESPLMIKAYLEKMGKSEILLVMTGVTLLCLEETTRYSGSNLPNIF
ncbi:MAG: concentrative nucleoside transporter CNT [Prolixibacteraceae bacterium]|nr:MAG: concentrative nucleoside transporter CNT [Prolixibacteraceae bacterium]